MELFSQLPDRSNSSLGLGFWGVPVLCPCLPPGRLLVFTSITAVRPLAFKSCAELGRGLWDEGKFKRKMLAVLTRIQPFSFFLNKHSLDCYRPIVLVLKMLIFNVFASVLFAFKDEQVFKGPYLTFCKLRSLYIYFFS